MITITDSAQEKIASIIESRKPDVKGLRIGYEGKNRYSMTLVDEMPENEDDIIVPFKGFEMVIDPYSASQMEGGSIDYIETPTESGFKIENPNDNREAAARPEGPPSSEGDKAIWQRVQDLIESDINPGVGMHGGVVNLIDVKDAVVYIEMGGGCQGCGMANVTLKQGIERILRSEVPDIVDILDVTDHAGGSNPYYAAAAK